MSKIRRMRFNDRILEILKLIIMTKNFSFEYFDEEFSNNEEARYSVERSLHRMSMLANNLEKCDFHISKDLHLHKLGRLEKILSNPYKEVNPEILLETIKELDYIEKNLRSYLGRDIPEDFPKVRSKYSVLKFKIPKEEKFDSNLLEVEVSNYLVAIADVQKIISEIKGEPFEDIEIISIVRNNPLNVNFKDGLEAVKLLLEYIIPWKRKHSKQIANLTEEEKQIQVEKLKLENEKTKVEIEAAKFEIKDKERKSKWEEQEKKVDLVLKILDKVQPDMSKIDTVKFTTMLLEPLEVIVESDLKLIERDKS